MKTWSGRINIYLLCLLTLALGCKTTEEKKKDKELSTLRLHLEVNQDGATYNMPVPIYRENPLMVNVLKDAFIDEGYILQAAVVETPGSGFAISLKLDPQGTLRLESATTAYKGQRIAVFSQFGDARWLAAPRINQRITSGIFTFTPDCTKTEAERIVNGINNVAKKLHKDYYKAQSNKF